MVRNLTVQMLSKVRPGCCIRRQFSVCNFQAQQKFPEAPDWSPTATENDVWLREIKNANVKKNISNVNTKDERFVNIEDKTATNTEIHYEVEKKQAPSLPKNHNILSTGKIRYQYKGTDRDNFLVLRVPLDQFTSLRSSPYSTLNSKRRPKSTSNNQNFSDIRIINLKSGKGGNGGVSFFRDAGRAIGPPDGGDGGNGGSIYVQAVEGINSLHKLHVTYAAYNGANGTGSQFDGPSAQDVVITVPVGTTIKWLPSTEVLKQAENLDEILKQQALAEEAGEDVEPISTDIEIKAIGPSEKHVDYIQLFRQDEQNITEDDNWIFKDKSRDYHYDKDWFNTFNAKVKKYDALLLNEELSDDVFPFNGLDLNQPSKSPILLLKGGRGGLGNSHFLTKDIRNPRFSKRGRPGLECNFLFELKMLADFGLVGMPNSGKSTLLNAISNAKSKVGHWEFTTLQPTIGTVIPLEDSNQLHIDNFTVADIPGIIEGAATCVEKPKGMGTEFLRHIERSKFLAVVVSLEIDPIKEFKILMKELMFGKDRISNKKILVVGTKADLVTNGKNFTSLRNYVTENFHEVCTVIPVCALKKHNVNRLIESMTNLIVSE